MDKKIAVLHLKFLDVISKIRASRDKETLDLIHRSLDSIRSEIEHGTPINPELIDELEERVTKLEQRHLPKK